MYNFVSPRRGASEVKDETTGREMFGSGNPLRDLFPPGGGFRSGESACGERDAISGGARSHRGPGGHPLGSLREISRVRMALARALGAQPVPHEPPLHLPRDQRHGLPPSPPRVCLGDSGTCPRPAGGACRDGGSSLPGGSPAGQMLGVYRVRGPVRARTARPVSGYVQYLVGILQVSEKMNGHVTAVVRKSFEDLGREDLIREEIPSY